MSVMTAPTANAFAATSPEAPSIKTVVWVSAVFGPFGAIPAYSRAKEAKTLGLSVARYWTAWLISWALSTIATAVLIIVAFMGLLMLVANGSGSYSSSAAAGSAPIVVAEPGVTQNQPATAAPAQPIQPSETLELPAVTAPLADGHYLRFKLAIQTTAGKGPVDTNQALAIATSYLTGRPTSDFTTVDDQHRVQMELSAKIVAALGSRIISVYFAELVYQ